MARKVELPYPEQRSRARLAPWSPVASREEVRAYLQDRMRLLSKVLFWIFWVLVGFVFALYEIYPDYRPERVDIVHEFAIAGLLLLALIWYFALHKRQVSIETLYRIDILYAMMVGTAFGLSVYYSSDQRANVYSALIWHTFMVFARVIIVPSTARRTTILTTASFVPLLIGALMQAIYFPDRLELPPVPWMIGSLLFVVIAVLIARTGSHVIYGLRRRVSEASQLGQYTLGEKLGEGGMGAVYKATHAMLRRPTAIKLLPLDKYDASSVTRFEREVQHTSELTHPNTVAIFDYGRSPDGVFYYAMEYLDGIDLERLVARYGAQPVDRVVDIMRQIAGALEEAHAMGLIHRDIKPANILLCQRGGKPDVAKVVDFGLVAEVAKEAGGARGVQGTPAYLSPEAVTDPGRVGQKSDLYSLGAVAYYLLAGVRVFDSATSVELCVAHASKPPTPLRDRTDHAIPEPLEALIMQCLEKSPSARPASAHRLRELLGEIPRTGDWSEAEAEVWWDAFYSERAARPIAGASPSQMTVTVDLTARTADLALPPAAQDRDTGQAR